jgi:hypothetical protein
VWGNTEDSIREGLFQLNLQQGFDQVEVDRGVNRAHAPVGFFTPLARRVPALVFVDFSANTVVAGVGESASLAASSSSHCGPSATSLSPVRGSARRNWDSPSGPLRLTWWRPACPCWDAKWCPIPVLSACELSLRAGTSRRALTRVCGVCGWRVYVDGQISFAFSLLFWVPPAAISTAFLQLSGS